MKHNRVTKALLKENRKALQFLHNGYGFDFESPVFVHKIEGRFTHNGVKKAIENTLTGSYIAVALIQPTTSYTFKKLHVIDIKASRFEAPNRSRVQMWKYNIDGFFSVGNFEDVRKNKTKAVFIIAQNVEFLKQPKARSIDNEARYKINVDGWRGGVERCGDGKGNCWISTIQLLAQDGKPEPLIYRTDRFSRFDRSDNLDYFIDKSGYLIREARNNLQLRAIELKQERDRAALEKSDYTEREKELKEKLKIAKRYLSDLILAAQTFDDNVILSRALNYLGQVLLKWDRLPKINFMSIREKTEYLDKIEILTNAILLIEEA